MDTTSAQFENELWQWYATLNKAPLYNSIGDIAVGIIGQNFEHNGRPVKWKPTSDNYNPTKIKLGGDVNEILRLSGKLSQSIDYNVSGETVTVGPTNISYAELMNFGGTSKTGYDIPARPYMIIPESELPYLYDIVKQFFDNI